MNACSSAEPAAVASPPGAVLNGDGGADADKGAPVDPRAPCPAASQPEGDGCATKLTFERAPQTLSPARDHHTTHVLEVGGEHFIYVFGGTPSWETVYDDIWRSKILPDGSLGDFERAGTLPKPRAGHMSVQVKDKLIFVAGTSLRNTQAFISNTVDIGTVRADGTVGDFVEGPKLPNGVMHHLIAQHGDWLFVFGGRGSSTGASITQVLRSKLGADGMPGPFEEMAPLPEARSHAMGFQLGDWFYMAGGLTGNPEKNPPPRDDVVRTRLGADGSVGEWEPAGKLPKGGLAVSAAQVFARQVFVLGGLPSGHSYTDKVYSAPIGADGMLGDFVTLGLRLPTPRAHVHQTPVYNDRIYSIGGHTDADESLDEVVIGKFAAP